MKKRILMGFLVFTFAKLATSQSSWANEGFYKDCTSGKVDWDTLSFNNKKIKYALIAKSYENTDQEGKHNFNGTIILLVDKYEIDSANMIHLFYRISDRIKLNKLIIFRSCEAHNLYISAMGPRDERQRNYLRENYLGTFDKSKVKL